MCLTKAFKNFITWTIFYLFLSEHQDHLCLFLKTKEGPSSASERDSVVTLELWRISFDPVRLALIRSVVIWGLSNLLGDSSSFFLSLFLFSTPPSFPPSPLSPVLKIHMVPTVYSEFTMLLLPLSSSPCSFCPLPSLLTRYPLPLYQWIPTNNDT